MYIKCNKTCIEKVGSDFITHINITANYRWTVLPLPSYTAETEDFIPYQRYGHTAVEYKNKVYIWGGRNDEAACNKLFIFDPGNFCIICVVELINLLLWFYKLFVLSY